MSVRFGNQKTCGSVISAKGNDKITARTKIRLVSNIHLDPSFYNCKIWSFLMHIASGRRGWWGLIQRYSLSKMGVKHAAKCLMFTDIQTFIFFLHQALFCINHVNSNLKPRAHKEWDCGQVLSGWSTSPKPSKFPKTTYEFPHQLKILPQQVSPNTQVQT